MRPGLFFPRPRAWAPTESRHDKKVSGYVASDLGGGGSRLSIKAGLRIDVTPDLSGPGVMHGFGWSHGTRARCKDGREQTALATGGMVIGARDTASAGCGIARPFVRG